MNSFRSFSMLLVLGLSLSTFSACKDSANADSNLKNLGQDSQNNIVGSPGEEDPKGEAPKGENSDPQKESPPPQGSSEAGGVNNQNSVMSLQTQWYCPVNAAKPGSTLDLADNFDIPGDQDPATQAKVSFLKATRFSDGSYAVSCFLSFYSDDSIDLADSYSPSGILSSVRTVQNEQILFQDSFGANSTQVKSGIIPCRLNVDAGSPGLSQIKTEFEIKDKLANFYYYTAGGIIVNSVQRECTQVYPEEPKN